MSYDSRPDTYEHIAAVRYRLNRVIRMLITRAHVHDKSKLNSPEREMFDEFTPKLRESTYGSEKYQNFLVEMGDALRHHYKYNSHHPEHYDEGIRGMNLLDIIEMLCDWSAAVSRHDGDITESIEINQKRFGYGDELKQILLNTVASMRL